ELEPTGEMWEAIRARITAEPRGRVKERSRWSGAFGRLLEPAVLRQTGFAILLIVLSVAATVYFTRPVSEKGQNIAGGDSGSRATPTPQQALQPAPIAIPPVAPPASAPGGRSALSRPKRENWQPARILTEHELIYQQIARAEREYRSAIRLLDSAI